MHLLFLSSDKGLLSWTVRDATTKKLDLHNS